MDADLSRRPRPDRGATELADAGDPELVKRIRDEIERGGPITFARFMERALFEPELGYYRRPANPADRSGDFLTAPETHPIFGATLARAIAAAWQRLGQPPDLTIREYGAGSGALARAILDGLAVDAPDPVARVRYEAVEINEHRHDALVPPIVALRPQETPRLPRRPAGIVVANEFLDALPVHRVQGSAEGLRELFVHSSGGAFVERADPPSTAALGERLSEEGVTLENGQQGEIALGLDEWFAEVAAAFERSVTIVIDYGYEAADLYAPRRARGTLLGYLGQTVIDDPFRNVGRQDLTAHVDFTAVQRAAERNGLATLEFTTQARFLVDNGIEQLLERARSRPDQSLGEYVELRSGLVRLLDPRAMGAFRVLILGKGIDGRWPASPTAPPTGIR